MNWYKKYLQVRTLSFHFKKKTIEEINPLIGFLIKYHNKVIRNTIYKYIKDQLNEEEWKKVWQENHKITNLFLSYFKIILAFSHGGYHRYSQYEKNNPIHILGKSPPELIQETVLRIAALKQITRNSLEHSSP